MKVVPLSPPQRSPDSPKEQCTYTTDGQGRFFCYDLGGYRLRPGSEYKLTAGKDFYQVRSLKFTYPSKDWLRLELYSSNDVSSPIQEDTGQYKEDGKKGTGFVPPP